MKRLVLAILTVAALAVPVCAQPPAAVVDIPFGFMAGNAAMPAGSYTVNIPADSSWVGLVDPDLHTHLLNGIPGGNPSGPNAPVLVFHRYGDQYFLSEIRTPSRSRELRESPMEREAETTASAGRANREVVLAMR